MEPQTKETPLPLQGNVAPPQTIPDGVVFSDPLRTTTQPNNTVAPTVPTQVVATNSKPLSEAPLKSTDDLLKELIQKVDNVELIVKKIKRHNTISMWLTIIFVILPLVGSIFALPYLINTYTSSMGLGDMSSLAPSEGENQAGNAPAPVPGKQVSDAQLLEMLHNLQSKVDAKQN